MKVFFVFIYLDLIINLKGTHPEIRLYKTFQVKGRARG